MKLLVVLAFALGAAGAAACADKPLYAPSPAWVKALAIPKPPAVPDGGATQLLLQDSQMRFGPDGTCTHIPGQKIIPGKARVPVYPTAEKYTFVWIWMGDVEKADPDLIVDYPPLADSKWRGLPGYDLVDRLGQTAMAMGAFLLPPAGRG